MIRFTNDYTAEDWIAEHNSSFEQLEREFKIEFTKDDKIDIAHMVFSGQDFYEAMYHWFND